VGDVFIGEHPLGINFGDTFDGTIMLLISKKKAIANSTIFTER
jgi:hypothetical protein